MKTSSCSDTDSKIDYKQMPYTLWLGLQRKEKNADKTLRILNRLYDAKQNRAKKNGYYPFYMEVMHIC
jgi:hypothetical protein